MPVMPVWIHFVIMLAVATLALLSGRRDIRLVASCYLLVNLLLTGFGSFDGALLPGLEIWVCAAEALVFTVALAVYRRPWLIVPCLISYSEVATGFAKTAMNLGAWTYGTIQITWFYALWISVAVASLLTIRAGGLKSPLADFYSERTARRG